VIRRARAVMLKILVFMIYKFKGSVFCFFVLSITGQIYVAIKSK
jgi:hypothetical protein